MLLHETFAFHDPNVFLVLLTHVKGQPLCYKRAKALCDQHTTNNSERDLVCKALLQQLVGILAPGKKKKNSFWAAFSFLTYDKRFQSRVHLSDLCVKKQFWSVGGGGGVRNSQRSGAGSGLTLQTSIPCLSSTLLGLKCQ